MLLSAAESIQVEEPAVPRRWRRRTVVVMLALFAFILAISGGLFWQATTGGVSLALLRPRIEAAIRSRLPADSEVTIGAVGASYDADRGLILRASDLLLGLPGAATFRVDELSTVTSPGAVLRGRVELSSVTISGLALNVEALPPSGTGSGSDLVRGAARAVVSQIVAADRLMREAGLAEVAIEDAYLSLAGGNGPPPRLHVREGTWQPFGVDRSKAWLQVVEESGAGWDVTLERRHQASGAETVMVEVEDLPVAAVAPALSIADGGPHFVSEITLQARLTSKPDGSFSSLRGVVSTGGGPLSLTGRDEINVVSTDLNFALGETGNRVTVRSASVRTRTGELSFEGTADLGQPGKMTFVGRVRGGALPTADPRRRVRLRGGGALLTVDFADLSVSVERLLLVTANGSVSAIGQAGFGDNAPGLSFALSMSAMPASVARAFWPPFIAARTRRWFDANVKSGTLGPATVQVALPPEFIGERGRDRPLPSYALQGTVPFQDAEFSPIKTFSVVRSAEGTIGFANGTATIRAGAGIVAVPGKGDLQVAGTSLTIPELGRRDPRGDLHLQLSGPAAALAMLSDNPPLSIATDRGIRSDDLSGVAALALDVNIPLSRDALGEVRPTFRLDLAGFSSASPIEGRMISTADLVLEGSPQTFTVTGIGMLDGIQASVNLMLGSAVEGQTDVTLTLDEAARDRLGLSFGGLLTGPVQAAVKNTAAGSQSIALDLKDARISLPFLGWEKGAGVPATAHFTLTKNETGTAITDLLVSGKGFSAKGNVSIGADGTLGSVDLTDFALRPGDRLQLTAKEREGAYDIRIAGAALDARGILRGASSGMREPRGKLPALRISLEVDSVTGQNDTVLSGVAGKLVVNSRGLDSVSLKGNAGGADPFEWTLGREGGQRVMRLFSENGGALLAFAGLYTKVGGGNLVLDYSAPLDETGTGVLLLREFTLINETALRPAIESARNAARDNPTARASMPRANELRFTQLRVPFRQKDWVIAIDEAALRGPTIGATASGTVNVPGGNLAISGTFIPAFGLNNIAGSIPVLGAILGGGRNEGLVGITYKLFGPIGSPELTMNPISAIAPGIFRKIFEYR